MFIDWLNNLIQALPEGTGETVSFLLSIKNLLGLGSIMAIIWKTGLKISTSIQAKRFDAWEKPIGLTTEDVIRLKRQYIKTRLSNHYVDSETRVKTYKINTFIRRYFKTEVCPCHWVLGEAGMGKTTFLTRLYYQYNTRLKIFKKFDKVFYLRFGVNKKYKDDYEKKDIDILHEYIKQVEEAKLKNPGYKSILLLDAFDEYIESHINPIAAQEKIYELIQDNFIVTIISCRTQFFDTKKSEPEYMTLRSAVDFMPSKCLRHYLQPFTNRDVKKYLRIVYPVWAGRFLINWKKRKTAKNIIRNAEDIFCRPFLLRFIEDMIQEGPKRPNDILEMYYIIVNKWIEREVAKTLGIDSRNPQYHDVELLWWNFLREIACKMYSNYASLSEYVVQIEDVDQLADELHINMEKFAKEGRSLLSRSDSRGDENSYFWFVHQSIFELILADCVAHGVNVFEKGDQSGEINALDQYKKFLQLMDDKCLLNSTIDADLSKIDNSLRDIFNKYNLIEDAFHFRFTIVFKADSIVLISINSEVLKDFNYLKLNLLLNEILHVELPELLTMKAIRGFNPRISNVYLVFEFFPYDAGLLSADGTIWKRQGKASIEVFSAENVLDVNVFDNDMPFDVIVAFILEQAGVSNKNMGGQFG